MLSKIRFITGIVILSLTVLCIPRLWFQDYAVRPGPDSGAKAVAVHIPDGTPLGGIKNILAGQSLIRSDIRFELLALMLGCADSLKAGHYSVAAGSTPLEILGRLEEGDITSFRLTIPEGYTVKQIAGLLEERFAYKQKEFQELCHNRTLIKSLGLKVKVLEGYLFPDTYQLNIGMPLESVIRKMVKRFQEVYDDLLLVKESRITSSFTRQEIVSMASIVEKETSVPAERPLVASVLVNRLRRNMLLQVDPTVIYGLGKAGECLSAADLIVDTPYNSYLHRGLPPGPICNPGRAALAAALNPARTPYLYFVARNDGSHEFSCNLREQDSTFLFSLH